MNRNYTIAIVFGAAAIAALALTAGTYLRPMTSGPAVLIDFNAYPVENDVTVERGDAVSVPIKIEAPADSERRISLSIMPVDIGTDTERDQVTGRNLPRGLTLELDRQTVTLSSTDDLEEIADGVAIREAGSLIISAAPDAAIGTYTFALEAAGTVNGEGAGVGTPITVSVK